MPPRSNQASPDHRWIISCVVTSSARHLVEPRHHLPPHHGHLDRTSNSLAATDRHLLRCRPAHRQFSQCRDPSTTHHAGAGFGRRNVPMRRAKSRCHRRHTTRSPQIGMFLSGNHAISAAEKHPGGQAICYWGKVPANARPRSAHATPGRATDRTGQRHWRGISDLASPLARRTAVHLRTLIALTFIDFEHSSCCSTTHPCPCFGLGWHSICDTHFVSLHQQSLAPWWDICCCGVFSAFR